MLPIPRTAEVAATTLEGSAHGPCQWFQVIHGRHQTIARRTNPPSPDSQFVLQFAAQHAVQFECSSPPDTTAHRPPRCADSDTAGNVVETIEN